MALEVGNLNLFGIDLRGLGRVWRNGWAEALKWKLFSWLSPSEPIRVLFQDGSESIRNGATALPADAGVPVAVAVALPEESVLLRQLILPRLAADELRQALELEVASVSPFPLDQVAWGWSSESRGDQLRICLAMAAQPHVADVLAGLKERLGGASPEVWANASAPVVLQGYGESGRAKRLIGARRRILAALSVVVVLLSVLAVTPVWQARARVFDAQVRYGLLENEVAPLVAARGQLSVANDRVRSIRALWHDRIDVPLLLETLTQSLPDDAFLSRIQIEGRKVRIVGQAENASQLMDALGMPGSSFRDVRAPSPISRVGGSSKENFVIDFVVADEEQPK